MSTIAQFHSGPQVHRFLRRYLRLSRGAASQVTGAVKYLRNPSQPGLRARMARDLVSATPTQDGYRLLEQGALPGTEAMLADCTVCFEAAREQGRLDEIAGRSKKKFLHSVLADAQVQERSWFNAYLSREMIAMASTHLGEVPLLTAARLWWTPANESQEKSQRWHCDGEDQEQLKFFVNVLDCDESNGPFTFTPASDSDRVRERLRYVQGRKLDDSLFEDARIVSLMGPAGSGGAVDTSHCFHYGSRGNRRDRLVLMLQFTRFCAPKVVAARWHDAPGLDPLQRLVLGLR